MRSMGQNRNNTLILEVMEVMSKIREFEKRKSKRLKIRDPGHNVLLKEKV